MVSTDSVPMALALIWSVGLEQPWPWSGQRLRQMCECWMVRAYPWVVLVHVRVHVLVHVLAVCHPNALAVWSR